jgi:hypothetical protein
VFDSGLEPNRRSVKITFRPIKINKSIKKGLKKAEDKLKKNFMNREIPKINKKPTFKSDTTTFLSKGNKTQLTKLNNRVIIGAEIYINLFEFNGIIGSLSINFNPSDKG